MTRSAPRGKVVFLDFLKSVSDRGQYMPRYSDDTLLQRAIRYAVLDRESLAECYGNEGEWAVIALNVVKKIETLVGKKLVSLTPEDEVTAFNAFVYAEQWQESLANAQALVKERSVALRLVGMFREVRLRRWGKTRQEIILESATLIKFEPGGKPFPAGI
jgi:hypothetical protein